jgi:hypothetical protein
MARPIIVAYAKGVCAMVLVTGYLNGKGLAMRRKTLVKNVDTNQNIQNSLMFFI